MPEVRKTDKKKQQMMTTRRQRRHCRTIEKEERKEYEKERAEKRKILIENKGKEREKMNMMNLLIPITHPFHWHPCIPRKSS